MDHLHLKSAFLGGFKRTYSLVAIFIMFYHLFCRCRVSSLRLFGASFSDPIFFSRSVFYSTPTSFKSQNPGRSQEHKVSCLRVLLQSKSRFHQALALYYLLSSPWSLLQHCYSFFVPSPLISFSSEIESLYSRPLFHCPE